MGILTRIIILLSTCNIIVRIMRSTNHSKHIHNPSQHDSNGANIIGRTTILGGGAATITHLARRSASPPRRPPRISASGRRPPRARALPQPTPTTSAAVAAPAPAPPLGRVGGARTERRPPGTRRPVAAGGLVRASVGAPSGRRGWAAVGRRPA